MNSFIHALHEKGDHPLVMIRYPNWVGDAVMALPALECIRRSLPEARLAVLAKPWVADVIDLSSLADHLIYYRDPGRHSGLLGKIRLARLLRNQDIDGSVFFQNAFEAAFLAFMAGIPLRAGYSTDGRRLFLSHPIRTPSGGWPPDHQVGYYVDLVRALGFNAQVEEIPHLEVPVSPDNEAGRIALAPGASFGPAKMWPAERYIELGRRLAGRGYRVLILGSRAEKQICARVAQGIGNGVEDLSGSTTIKEAATIMASLEIMVCNDSGLMHLGAAVGAPLVALFGSTDPQATGPISKRSLVIRGSAQCAPCFQRTCSKSTGVIECFEAITVDRVESACIDILSGKKDIDE